jgi:hypothetical protein
MVAGCRPPSPGAAGAAVAGFAALPLETVESGLICFISFERLFRRDIALSDVFFADVFFADVFFTDALLRDAPRFIGRS